MSTFTLAFPALVLGRLLVSFVTVSASFKNDSLLSSPLTAYPRLQEGLFLLEHGIDPYSGGVCRHSPLYISLFSTVLSGDIIPAHLLWTICDAVAAWALTSIWRARQGVLASSRDTLIAAFYLYNPYLFLPSLALSTSAIDNMLLVLAVMFASRKKASLALFCIAFLIHTSLSSVLLIAPIVMMLASASGPSSTLVTPQPYQGSCRKACLLTLELTGYFSVLILASFFTTNGLEWIPQTWGAIFTLPDLTPNCGLWWYFFTEMFDHFRPFFLMAFSVNLLIYIAPVCIKFQYDPLYAVFVLVGVLGTFKAYPTLSDPGLFLSMMSIFQEIYPYLRHPIVTVLLHLHAALLMPLFRHLWLDQGTGNANFFYASTLVFACSNGAALMDSIWAGLRVAIGDVGKEGEEWSVVQE